MNHPEQPITVSAKGMNQWAANHKIQIGLTAVSIVFLALIGMRFLIPDADPVDTSQILQSGGLIAATPIQKASSYKSVFEKASQPTQPPKSGEGETPAPTVYGVAFVESIVNPIRKELNRFYGWRSNDLIRPTDNVNNFQKGVLEVARRSAVALAKEISRTGSSEAFNPGLERAMNWFMVSADSFWFPSAESKYKAGIREWEKYLEDLKEGKANFYTRPDNLIPLLSEYEHVLGGCDENLVKDDVGYFKADNHFYYAKGAATAMKPVLKAVLVDFEQILDQRHADEALHHAIKMLEIAESLEPLLVLDSDLDGLFSNHRANMAAPISHARFYIGVVIKALST